MPCAAPAADPRAPRSGTPPARLADQRDEHARGLILAFTVADLEGERAFQVRDPNGVIIQLVDWKG